MVSNDSRFVYNEQLFADEIPEVQKQEATPEQQVNDYFDKVETDFVESKKPNREPVQEEQQEETPDTQDDPVDEPEELDKEVEPEKESTKVKFKENGQDVELTMDELIARAQKGANYERKVQELATQRKAFELALQKQPEPVKATPADELASYAKELEQFAVNFKGKYGVDYNQFDPIHIAKFAESRMEKRELQRDQNYQHQQIQQVEGQFQNFVRTATAEKDFSTINKVAQEALFLLPTKGAEGMQEFQKMYPIYQKINQRDQYANQVNAGMQPTVQLQPFTADEVQALNTFYNTVKSDFYAKKTVPKSAPRKQPTKTERPGTGDVDNSPRFDYKKVASMDGDELDTLYNNMFSQKLKEK